MSGTHGKRGSTRPDNRSSARLTRRQALAGIGGAMGAGVASGAAHAQVADSWLQDLFGGKSANAAPSPDTPRKTEPLNDGRAQAL